MLESNAQLERPEEVAARIGVPLKTLYQWRMKQKGPRAIKIGRHLRYDRVEVDRWLAEQTDDWDAA